MLNLLSATAYVVLDEAFFVVPLSVAGLLLSAAAIEYRNPV